MFRDVDAALQRSTVQEAQDDGEHVLGDRVAGGAALGAHAAQREGAQRQLHAVAGAEHARGDGRADGGPGPRELGAMREANASADLQKSQGSGVRSSSSSVRQSNTECLSASNAWWECQPRSLTLTVARLCCRAADAHEEPVGLLALDDAGHEGAGAHRGAEIHAEVQLLRSADSLQDHAGLRARAPGPEPARPRPATLFK